MAGTEETGPLDRLSLLLTRVKGGYWELGFWILLEAYLVVSLVESLSFRPMARLFPLVVLVPTVALVAARIALILGGEILDVEFDFELPFGDVLEERDMSGYTKTTSLDKPTQYRRELILFGWLGALVVVIWAIGFYPAMALFLTSFIYRRTRDIKTTATVTILGTGAAYLVFQAILSTTMWEGVLFGARM